MEMSKYWLSPQQHRRRARRLRQWPRYSHAAELHELAADMQERLAKARDNVGSYWQPNEPGITPLRDTAR
jgi:hypothetical protein